MLNMANIANKEKLDTHTEKILERKRAIGTLILRLSAISGVGKTPTSDKKDG